MGDTSQSTYQRCLIQFCFISYFDFNVLKPDVFSTGTVRMFTINQLFVSLQLGNTRVKKTAGQAKVINLHQLNTKEALAAPCCTGSELRSHCAGEQTVRGYKQIDRGTLQPVVKTLDELKLFFSGKTTVPKKKVNLALLQS